MKISRRLKALLAEQKISVSELARKILVSRPTVHRWLAGSHDIQLDCLNRLSAFLRVPVTSWEDEGAGPWASLPHGKRQELIDLLNRHPDAEDAVLAFMRVYLSTKKHAA